ncbi:MAG TPA: chlorohydrolase [Porphyromonadaceae bacterium]|nr:chlorohydrolase [Porphyromonadaceae bacterium]
MSILIKQVLLYDKEVDVLIKDNIIAQIGENICCDDCEIIDGRKKAIIPGLVNCHTHAAMTLFRGFADDMKLEPWLTEKIWPNEAKLTEEDVYWGAKLACLEMIRTGTTSFLDMYHMYDATAQAVEEMGIRGFLTEAFFDHFDSKITEKVKKRVAKLINRPLLHGDRIRMALGPHAIYTVSGELLRWSSDVAKEHDMLLHLHLAETEVEVQNSLKNFGLTPVRYLKELGILSPNLVVAHCIWLDDEEMKMLADHDVKVVHNPNSNLKLASGMHFKADEMRKAGITVGLGTDGCSSSNNLDMVEVMKVASLLGKAWRKDPEAMTAPDVFDMATKGGAHILGLNAGEIKEGMLADIALVDLKIPAFAPNFNFVSNLVYAANGYCIDTVICDGKVLMRNKQIKDEDLILDKASDLAYKLMER